jgi:ribosomal protein S1
VADSVPAVIDTVDAIDTAVEAVKTVDTVDTEVISAASTVVEGVVTTTPSVDTLRPREHLKGKITRTELGGAFVDIGIGVDGFMHISQIASANGSPVTRVADALKPGDEVDVYVSRVNQQRKRVELTMHRPAAFGWDNLPIGSKLEGAKVVSVESFGAFVDFDGPKHGLIPFNLMPKGVRPKVGDAIDIAWVVEVDEAKRRIGLTMIEPPALPWERIKRGDMITGKVTRVERNGAWVDIGAERDGMIRASAMGMSFVDMHALVSEGEEVTVKVTKVDPSRKQIDLALDGVNPDDYALSSGPEEDISPFAAAFQRAQRLKKAQTSADVGDRPVKKNNPQNELLDRTLQQMQEAKK